MREVSVVVATRDRREELLGTLSRLVELPERPAVIVVDDASSDGTSAAVRRRYPQVEVITLRDNHGATARNVGVRHAATEVVAFADDDSWWEPGSLQRATQLFDAHPTLALLLAAIVVHPDGAIDPACEKAGQALIGRPAALPGPSIIGHLACGAVVRRQAFLDAGGYSALLHFGGEEQLLSLDLAARGWAQCYVAEVIAHHAPSSSREGWGQRWARYRRNDTLTCWLRRPLPRALSATAGLVADAVREPAARPALAELVQLLPEALRHRRPVPAAVERQFRALEVAG